MTDELVLKSFGDEAAGQLSQTLGALVGREVLVNFVQALNRDTAEVSSSFDRPYLCANLKGSGGIEGTGILLTRENESAIIADLLIGQDGTNAPEQMTELHLSAFGEVVHQMVEVFSREVKKTAGAKALWDVKGTEVLDPTGAGKLLSQLGPSVIVFSFGLFIQDLLAGELLFCVPVPAADRIFSDTGKPAGSTPAGSLKTGVSSANTQSRVGGGQMQQLESEFSGSTRPTGGNIGLLLDVPLKLTVELGRTTKLVKEILALAPGSVVELDKLAGEAVDILVNEKLIAKGEVVVIDENFGVRITEIINPEERLTAVQS